MTLARAGTVSVVNVTELAVSLGRPCCSALLGYYVFSGEDCTSAFKGEGALLNNYHAIIPTILGGDEWKVKPLQEQLEGYTCVTYSQASETSTWSGVHFARLPPCQDSLIPHIQWVNYRVVCYKRAAEPVFWRPKPYDGDLGWEKSEGGILEPVWSCGPILPPSCIDLLAAGVVGDDEGEEDEVEIDDEMDDDDDQ